MLFLFKKELNNLITKITGINAPVIFLPEMPFKKRTQNLKLKTQN